MTKELLNEVYESLKLHVLPHVRDNDLMNILSSIWDVYQRNATGEDGRYKVLGDEIEKHYIMNSDWPDDKLFVRILRLYDDDSKFKQFVEQLLLLFHKTEYFDAYSKILTPILSKELLTLNITQNEQGQLSIRIGDAAKNSPLAPVGALKFYVCESNIYNFALFFEKDVKWPADRNCFVLTNNYGWNDYSYYTRYRLYYVKDGNPRAIGEVKIMKEGEDNTSEQLPKEFYALDDDYCSLGYNTSYYTNLRQELGKEAPSVLSQLRDTAFYESIYKKFENNSIFQVSLLRTNEAEKARREGRYYVYGRDMDDAYAFTYQYKPPYPANDIEIKFNYKYSGKNFERIIGIIGENGVGKTTLIKQLLYSLLSKDDAQFTGLRPLFSSVLMISYSPFDHYQVAGQEGRPFINYEYSGLMKTTEQLYSTREQVEMLVKNIKTIYRRECRLASHWEELINQVIPFENIAPLISERADDANEVEVDSNGLERLCERASSGETMYLYSISAIMARIRHDSLIILDEPEQHLHPGAITALMHSIYKILELYNSYALISTHSPYVIRELVSPNVMLFKRFDGGLSVSRIGIESFGEDISVLSDIVFDNMSEEKRYEKFIEEVVNNNNYNYEASIRELQTGPNALSLNAKLLIRTIINKRDSQDEAFKA